RTSTTTPRGYTTSFTYDAAGRLATETQPNGGVMTNVYDALGRRTQVKDQYSKTTTTTYDLLNRVLTVTNPASEVTTNEYDHFDAPTTVTRPGAVVTVGTFDPNGHRLRLARPTGVIELWTYDLLNRVLTHTVGGQATTYAHDDRGRVTQVTAPNGLVTKRTYDLAGQVVTQTTVLGGGLADEVETTTYDAAGNRLSFTDGNGEIWQYTYDAVNRLVATANPLSTPGDPHVATRKYDAAGRLVERTDANGTRILQEYNADGQLTRVLYPTGRDVRYEWTCCRLSAMADEFGTSRFTYDLANRLTSALDPFGHLVTYRYDAAGRRSEMGVPGGASPVKWAYTNGLLRDLTDADGATTRVDIAHGSQLTGLRFDTAGLNLQTTVTYHATQGYPSGMSVTSPAITETYTLADAAWAQASPLSATSSVAGTSYEDSLTVRKDLRAATERHRNLTAGTEYQRNTYAYTKAQALSTTLDQKTVPNPTTYQFYDGNNRLQAFKTTTTQLTKRGVASNVEKDRNGNIVRLTETYTSGGTQTFTWEFRYDAENRLLAARATDTGTAPATDLTYTFGYDGIGRRVTTALSGAGPSITPFSSVYVYDGDRLIQERNAVTDALVVEYTNGPAPHGPAGVATAIYKQRRPADAQPVKWIYTSPQGGFPRFLFRGDTGALTDTLQYSAKGDKVLQSGSTEVAGGLRAHVGFGMGLRFALSMDAKGAVLVPLLGAGLQKEQPNGLLPPPSPSPEPPYDDDGDDWWFRPLPPYIPDHPAPIPRDPGVPLDPRPLPPGPGVGCCIPIGFIMAIWPPVISGSQFFECVCAGEAPFATTGQVEFEWTRTQEILYGCTRVARSRCRYPCGFPAPRYIELATRVVSIIDRGSCPEECEVRPLTSPDLEPNKRYNPDEGWECHCCEEPEVVPV
ncbi:MAG TPA: hypothetical protein VEI97_04280, partial [bacterium]|nr:hypothetical protein [bacterium]